jgi:cbb3-type cytochrome oxidase subunit 1
MVLGENISTKANFQFAFMCQRDPMTGYSFNGNLFNFGTSVLLYLTEGKHHVSYWKLPGG